MKYNLKNRPVKSTPQAYERFLKGMEAELREIWEINKNRTMMIDASDSHQAIGQIDVIREVLGE